MGRIDSPVSQGVNNMKKNILYICSGGFWLGQQNNRSFYLKLKERKNYNF